MKRVDQKPRARTQRLLVEEMADETLVYDLETHRAHCLNPSAAFVWQRADGETSIAAMAAGLSEAGLPEDPSLVWMAVERLQDAGLLAERVTLPDEPPRFTRKEVLRILGAAAGMTLVFPAVDSVSAPLAAQAASCLTSAQCNALIPNAEGGNCLGLPICSNRAKCCKEVRRGQSTTCSPNNFC